MFCSRLKEAGAVLLGTILKKTVLTKDYIANKGTVISDLW